MLRREVPLTERPSAVLERSAPAENLLKRAREAIDRQDWKLAVDSLQRVIDDPAAGLLECGLGSSEDSPASPNGQAAPGAGPSALWESARRRAARMLAGLPPDGLAVYRLLHDGRAETLFQKALESGDAALLRQVVEHYLASSWGDDAADVLAGWYLDRGWAGHALDTLDQMGSGCADSDVPRWRTTLQRAVAWHQLRHPERVVDLLSELGPAENYPPEAAAAIRLVRESLDLKAGATRVADAASELPAASPGLYVQSEVRAATGDWPTWGGDGTRRNVMPPAAAELRANLPWRCPLPADDPDWWEKHLEEQSLLTTRPSMFLPAVQAVVQAGRLFVRGGEQVVALDADTLNVAWLTGVPAPAAAERRVRFRRGRFQLEEVQGLLPGRTRPLYDFVGNSLTAAFGLVLSVEREGASSLLAGVQRLAALPGAGFGGDMPRGNRLAAWDCDTGRLRWQQGRSSAAGNGLSNVLFMSSPLNVGAELWVPYLSEGDLYLAALSPADGRMLRKLDICGVAETDLGRRAHEGLLPACDGRLFYLPTGAGLLVAVDVDDFTLRWAAAYPRQGGSPDGGYLTEPTDWLPSAPVVAAGSVFLAPADGEQLWALDCATGRMRWVRTRPEGAAYILAADETRIWLGGETITCLATADGAVVWQQPADEALPVTGRGVLSGPTILVPTTEGLVKLSAADGKHLETGALPADQLPLGNLLCVDGALVSIDTNEVRKFPDVEMAYARQVAHHQAHPEDADSALRVVWMELLRGAPDRAYAVLDDLTRSGRLNEGRAERLAVDAAQLRVDVLLALAQQTNTDAPQALEYLREAVLLARAPLDRLRAGLPLAAQLRRDGQFDEAYWAAWDLAVSECGDAQLTVAPRLRNRACVVIADLLSRWERDLSARQLGLVAERTGRALCAVQAQLSDPETQAAARQRLERMAAINDAVGTGQAAAILLADLERAAGRSEAVEQYLSRALRYGRLPGLTAKSLHDLAEIAAGLEGPLPRTAQALLDRLSGEFALTPLTSPCADAGATPSSVDSASAAGRLETGSDAARRVADLLASRPDAAGRHSARPRRVRLKNETPGELLRPGSRLERLLEYTSTRAEAADDRLLVVPEEGHLAALSVADGTIIWRTRLGLLESPAGRLPGEGGADSGVAVPVVLQEPILLGSVLGEGQIAVVNTVDGLFGVGLRSGRRLWGVPWLDAAAVPAPDPDASLPLILGVVQRLVEAPTETPAAAPVGSVAVHDGTILYLPRTGVLAAAALADARNVRWERVLTGGGVGRLEIEGSYGLVTNASGRTVQVLDLATGREQCTLDFEQGRREEPLWPVCLGKLVCGPSGGDAAMGRDLRSGAEQWRVPLGEELDHVFRAADEVVGLVGFNGRLLLVDSLDGGILLDAALPAAADSDVVAGIIYADTLLCLSVDADGEASLASIGRGDGELRWTRTGLGSCINNVNLYARLLSLTDDVVVLPFVQPGEVVAHQLGPQHLGLRVVDKLSGDDYGPVVVSKQELRANEDKVTLFELFPGRLAVGTGRGLLSVAVEDEW